MHRHIHDFAFIPGYQQHRFEDQDPINLRAVRIMDDLHDALEAGGYRGHELERFLVRVLFCLFAEDTGIFEREAFRLYIEDRTKPDGSDLGLHLARLFDVLNTPPEKRQKNLDETLAAFPYVNGELFAEKLGFADFNRDMRNSLLACTRFDWSCISPAIFGSLFQGVMEPRERRQIGGHYTSERDILKVIRALFLDDLRAEFERIKGNKNQLRQFHQKLAGLRFLDPACGCGNFLVIAYRELRLLEIEVLEALQRPAAATGHRKPFAGRRGRLLRHRDQRVARADRRSGDVADGPPDERPAFGGVRPILRAAAAAEESRRSSAATPCGWTGRRFFRPSSAATCWAIRRSWESNSATAEQKADMELVCGDVKGGGVLDYVTGWYFKAAEYIRGHEDRRRLRLDQLDHRKASRSAFSGTSSSRVTA